MNSVDNSLPDETEDSHETVDSNQPQSHVYLLDLMLYLSVMFLIRHVYFPGVHFIVNGLFWSATTLVIASWRMKARGVSWKDLGLRKPKSYKSLVLVTALILALIPASIVAFEMIKDYLPFQLAPDTSDEAAVSKFGNLKANWPLFLMIMPFVLVQSMLEELLDRGFLITWIERTFSSMSFATVLAVILQAAIFGFRHSNDLSTRSITVGLIGLVMGTGYVAFGRNLWPLILAHCLLNGMSMAGRVVY